MEIDKIICKVDKYQLQRLILKFKSLNAYIEVVQILVQKISESWDDKSFNGIDFCQNLLNSIIYEVSGDLSSNIDMLSSLSLTERESLRSSIILQLKESKNDYLQKTLVYWLYKDGNDYEFKKLQIEHVKAAIRDKTLGFGSDLNLVNLKLYKYFIFHQEYLGAFQVMRELSCLDQSEIRNNEFTVPESEVISIPDRITFLDMGLECLDKRDNLSIYKEGMKETRKVFEIQAFLSMKMKGNIIEKEVELNKEGISNETIEELISEIKHLKVLETLLSRSAIDHKTLATEFIEILSAYDCEQLLLVCLNSLSNQEIEQAWRNLIMDCKRRITLTHLSGR